MPRMFYIDDLRSGQFLDLHNKSMGEKSTGSFFTNTRCKVPSIIMDDNSHDQGRRHGFLSGVGGGDEALWIQQDFCPMMEPRNPAFSLFSGFDPLYFRCSRFVLFVLRTFFHCVHSGISSKPRASWDTKNKRHTMF